MWFEGYHQNLIKLVSIIVLLLLIERCKTEKIRPGHAPLWGEHRVVQLRQDQANIEARERDPEWGYFEKTDLPPWMEPAFLNRHEEDDFLVSGRVKRNAEDGNDEDSEEVMPKHFRSLKRKEIPVTYRLHRDLLQYYRKGTRPVAHPNKLISVSMSVFLYQIVKLDAVKNTISLSGSFELYWQDEFLRWNPENYEGANEIFMSSSEIWIPEFSLYYSLNFNDAVKLLSNNDVRVNYTGHIRYYIPFSTESLCKLDVRFFPFDIQQCSLLLGSWAHSNDSIKYSLYSKNLSLIDFYDNQEWELDKVHSTVTADGFLYDYLDPPLFWEMIIIDLVMVRQSFYYVFNLVIPSTIITLVAVIGFHTPSTSGRVRDAKFRLGIMTLMSMSVILLAIVEDMPKFSMSSTRKGRGSFSGIPLIGLYYFILLAIIGLSTVTTSMFVFLEKDVRRKHVIPWYLVWLSFDIPAANQMHHRVLTEKRKDKLLRKELMVEDSQPQSSNEQRMFQNEGQLANNSKMKDCALSMVKIVNNGESSHDMPYQDSTTLFNESAISRDFASRQSSESRTNLKKRLNISTNDNLLSYQYFSTTLEEAMKVFESVETSVANIRKDMSQMIPQDDIHGKWQVVIRRLELISLMFYVSLLFSTMFLFFYHDWYCAVGNNPCGEQRNLKCKCGV